MNPRSVYLSSTTRCNLDFHADDLVEGTHGPYRTEDMQGFGYGLRRMLLPRTSVNTANFSVVDPYRMMRTKGFAEGLTLGAYSTDRACMACAGQYQRNLL